MVRFISIILIVFATTVSAQKIFDSKGHPFARRQGRSQEPKEIVDTVRMDGSGFGFLELQKAFKSKQHSTTPTAKENIHVTVTQVLDSADQTVASYSYWVSATLDTIHIKSTNGSDASLVNVRAIIK